MTKPKIEISDFPTISSVAKSLWYFFKYKSSFHLIFLCHGQANSATQDFSNLSQFACSNKSQLAKSLVLWRDFAATQSLTAYCSCYTEHNGNVCVDSVGIQHASSVSVCWKDLEELTFYLNNKVKVR